jgi:uncharacterized protein YjlB
VSGGTAPRSYPLVDDGTIPNSPLPLLVYEAALPHDASPQAFEGLFAAHRWTGSWRNGIYAFHHYHSTTHEVLGIYSGTAKVKFGGRAGVSLAVSAGDVVVIPAGVGHCLESGSADLGVVGAYPDGRDWNLCRGLAGERPAADAAIAAVPLPQTDPLGGATGPLPRLWAAAAAAARDGAQAAARPAAARYRAVTGP